MMVRCCFCGAPMWEGDALYLEGVPEDPLCEGCFEALSSEGDEGERPES